MITQKVDPPPSAETTRVAEQPKVLFGTSFPVDKDLARGMLEIYQLVAQHSSSSYKLAYKCRIFLAPNSIVSNLELSTKGTRATCSKFRHSDECRKASTRGTAELRAAREGARTLNA